MADAVSLDFIGATLRAIQAEQRNLQLETELIRQELGRLAGTMVTRELLSEVLRLIMERIGNFEALVDTRIDQLGGRLDQLGGRLDQMSGRLDQMSDQMAQVLSRLDQPRR